MVRSEWVTDVATARGGPIADAVGALAFGANGLRSSTLYVATASSLSVRRKRMSPASLADSSVGGFERNVFKAKSLAHAI